MKKLEGILLAVGAITLGWNSVRWSDGLSQILQGLAFASLLSAYTSAARARSKLITAHTESRFGGR